MISYFLSTAKNNYGGMTCKVSYNPDSKKCSLIIKGMLGDIWLDKQCGKGCNFGQLPSELGMSQVGQSADAKFGVKFKVQKL